MVGWFESVGPPVTPPPAKEMSTNHWNFTPFTAFRLPNILSKILEMNWPSYIRPRSRNRGVHRGWFSQGIVANHFYHFLHSISRQRHWFQLSFTCSWYYLASTYFVEFTFDDGEQPPQVPMKFVAGSWPSFPKCSREHQNRQPVINLPSFDEKNFLILWYKFLAYLTSESWVNWISVPIQGQWQHT